MNIHRPDHDAYGRVTNPGRFQVVVDATLAPLDELELVFDVTRVRRGTEITLTPPWGVCHCGAALLDADAEGDRPESGRL